MEQLLHKLIKRIKKICIGFNDHKQLVFILVQSLKMLFLYTQLEKDSIEDYTWNFQSLWDTVKAFGGSPGVHQGLIEVELAKQGITTPRSLEMEAAEQVTAEQVKAALLISGADRKRDMVGSSRMSWQTTIYLGLTTTQTFWRKP